MAKYKVVVTGRFTHEYDDIIADSADEAEREALSMLEDGRESVWFELDDFDTEQAELIEEN